jgi:hypothetical protein
MVRCTASPSGQASGNLEKQVCMASSVFPVGKVTCHFLRFCFFFFLSALVEISALCIITNFPARPTIWIKSLAFLTMEVVRLHFVAAIRFELARLALENHDAQPELWILKRHEKMPCYWDQSG